MNSDNNWTTSQIYGKHANVTTNDRIFIDIEKRINSLVATRDEKKRQLGHATNEKKRLSKKYNDSLKAQRIVQFVAKEVQKDLEYHISNIVSMALFAVFPDPYDFEIEFVERRGKTECDIFFVKDKERMDPVLSSGGGPLDVASFALRCAFWSLKKTRPMIILDEPFRFVSVSFQEQCADMLKTISKKLGIQIVMISHLPKIISSADKIFDVSQVNGISKIDDL